ncbi:DUF418 domain-containing protein [Brevibacterium sp. 50QC2O2]|uniref:DUF418 domain-containing protein n=1 Tax=Brevibacterium sp. 50QC2O2 TaxID=2968459 RepID=UPI00211BA8FD|nr:DUF418 domain-containing protein [Brevibacterium sp. 50QC2O2]MCQ9388094.1 DUF418 domain-containing protein [Brevibacterium sp. 50QC2O2]
MDLRQPAPAPTGRDDSPTARLDGLDAIRGFALVGILLVNIGPLLHLPVIDTSGTVLPAYGWLQDFVQNRFFPIFSLLFGVGFGIMWRRGYTGAQLLRRMLFLAVLGSVHQLFQPGEALLPYALDGLVLLVPISRLPRATARARTWTDGCLGLAGMFLLVAGVFLGGGLALIPGLFLLGALAGVRGLAQRIEACPRAGWTAGSTAIVGASLTLLVFAQTTALERLADTRLSAGLGLLMAATYVAAFIFLLSTPVRRPLVAVFAPLGRMACTNYLSATLLILLFSLAFTGEFGIGASSAGRPAEQMSAAAGTVAWRVALLFAGVVFLAQWAWSTAWLRRFRMGPVEYLWRWCTGWRRPQLRRTTSTAAEVPAGRAGISAAVPVTGSTS